MVSAWDIVDVDVDVDVTVFFFVMNGFIGEFISAFAVICYLILKVDV